jgi:hypothetical protein
MIASWVAMVKLQKHRAYTYTTDSGKEIEHYKHTVVIPENTLRELGWKAGVELKVVTKGKSLVLKSEERYEDE